MVRFTRAAAGVELGASPRAGLHLMTACKARALASGRTVVEIEDAVRLAPSVLVHRLNADNAREIAEGAIQAGLEGVS
jgi:MoxR-like ATPase